MLRATKLPAISPVDRLVTAVSRRNPRGAARLRRILRGNFPVLLVKSRTIDGLTFYLDPENWMDGHVLYGGYYQREVLDAILAALPPGGVFWDIGANIGLHSVTAKALRPDATVVAIEPAPLPATRIIQNAELNGVDVSLAAFALGGDSGYQQFSLMVRGNSGLSSFTPWNDVAYDGRMLTRCERADDLIASGVLPAPDVLKIDVEGFELEVLRGMPALLASGKLRAVIFEAHPDRVLPEGPFGTVFGPAGYTIESLPPAEKGEALLNYVARRA